MSFWQIDVGPFVGIAGSAIVSAVVVLVTLRSARRAGAAEAQRREEYFQRSVDEQRAVIERLAGDLTRSNRDVAEESRATIRANAALEEVSRLIHALTQMVSIGSSAGRSGPDVQALTQESMAASASVARVGVLLPVKDSEFVNLLQDAVEIFRDRAAEFTPFGTRPKPRADEMARFASAIIGTAIEWFRPGRDEGCLLSQLRLVRDELDAYLRREWPPQIGPLPGLLRRRAGAVGSEESP